MEIKNFRSEHLLPSHRTIFFKIHGFKEKNRKPNQTKKINKTKKPLKLPTFFSFVSFWVILDFPSGRERLASALLDSLWKQTARKLCKDLTYWTGIFQCGGYGGGSLRCLVPFELQWELRFWDLMLLQWRGETGSQAAVCLSPPQAGRQPLLGMLKASSCPPPPRLLHILNKCEYLRAVSFPL